MQRIPGRHPVRDRDVDARVRSAADSLEEDIVLGILHPRERLIEDDLCSRFGIKRHVARTVLAELERRGLVDRRKNVGACVKSYTSREVLELYAVREILETNAARWIPMPVPPEKLAALARILARYDASARRGALRGVFRANIDFHRELFALSDNRALNEAVAEYGRRTHAIRSASIVVPRHLAKAQREHHEIVDSLRSGDRKRLVSLCRGHLLPARDAYLELHHRLRDPV
jgi:DNA-binding GntR family transcriptional regulator